MDKKILTELIFNSIEEFNDINTQDKELPKGLDTKLFGKGGELDSLGLVNFIIIVEQMIEDEFEINITIADNKAMSQKKSPFLTINSLVDYLELILNKNG
jgi:acyl carrier protein